MDVERKPKLNFRSSWDDGHPADVKIAQLLLQYNLPGIFYIPSNTELAPAGIKMFDANGFKIGGHTATHPADLKLLSDDQLRTEIIGNKLWLEDIIGKKIDSFCYPRGRYNDNVIHILKVAGYKDARTTVVLKTESADPFRTDTAIHVFQRSEYKDLDWQVAANRMVEWACKTDGIFHIWGHGWEIERDKNWQRLEMFFDWLTENYKIIPV